MTMSGAPSDLAELHALAIAADPVSHEVVLSFRNSGRLFSARATGVDELLAHEFLRENILDEVKTWGRESDAHKLRDLLAISSSNARAPRKSSNRDWLRGSTNA